MTLRQRTLLRLVAVASAGAAIGGIGYAVLAGSALDGQRGGAIAVALSLGALFAARDIPEQVLDARADTVEDRLARAESTLGVMLDSQRLEKVYLAATSVAGSLIWGFGDLVAIALGAPP
jgi:hypothetical protein